MACSIQSPRACATCARLNRRSLPLFTARSAPSTRVTPAIRYTTPLVVSSITSARHWAILRLPQRRQVQHGHFALEHVYAISFHSFKLCVQAETKNDTPTPADSLVCKVCRVSAATKQCQECELHSYCTDCDAGQHLDASIAHHVRTDIGMCWPCSNDMTFHTASSILNVVSLLFDDLNSASSMRSVHEERGGVVLCWVWWRFPV